MAPTPRFDFRPGVTEPVFLVISRQAVEACDVASILTRLKLLLETREDAWRYRGQMTLVVDGYNDDPRKLVDITEVRAFLRELDQRWPYWAFFFNLTDDSIKLLAACVCGDNSPGASTVEINAGKLGDFLHRGSAGMNSVFYKHGFPEEELESMSRGVMNVMEQAGMA